MRYGAGRPATSLRLAKIRAKKFHAIAMAKTQADEAMERAKENFT